MALAVYNQSTNQVHTFIRDDHGDYLPPSGYELIDPANLRAGWTLEPDTAMADLLAALRGAAKEQLDAQSSSDALLRAVVLVLIDELNVLRQWLTAFKVQTAAATNLANFQLRVAGLPATTDRTAQQARDAIKTKLDAGDADT